MYKKETLRAHLQTFRPTWLLPSHSFILFAVGIPAYFVPDRTILAQHELASYYEPPGIPWLIFFFCSGLSLSAAVASHGHRFLRLADVPPPFSSEGACHRAALRSRLAPLGFVSPLFWPARVVICFLGRVGNTAAQRKHGAQSRFV